MEREDAPGLARRAGERLTARLVELGGVGSVRGLGLLLAVELIPGLDARVVADAALGAGLVVNAVTPTAIRLAPPLLVSDDEIEEAVAILSAVMTSAMGAATTATADENGDEA
jgi:acetylornithine/succinyldiaminopimelate/putrescine aminotransferase